MIPFARWAESSVTLQQLASRYSRTVSQIEPMTSIKIGCVILSLILLNALGLYTLRSARKLGLRHDWLIWAFLIAILDVSYAARYEQALWYPYDVPHLVFFGLATLFLLEDRVWPFALALMIDIPMRETSLYLILAAVAMRFQEVQWRVAAAVGIVLWGADSWLAKYLYPNISTEYDIRRNIGYFAPWHTPQLMSIVGFLLLPIWMSRKYLSTRQQRLLTAVSLMMLISLYFSTPVETRVWSEWSVLFAAFASLELETSFTKVG
jgi:hypothetical protein